MSQKIPRRAFIGTASLALAGLADISFAAEKTNMDPDLEAIASRLKDDAARGVGISPLQKYCALLAVVTTQALSQEAAEIAQAALKAGIEPIVIKEAVYQCAPYVGIGKVKASLSGVNEALKANGVPLPLPSQTRVNDANRRISGENTVLELNGDRMRQILAQVPKDEYELRVNDLYDFCFGDFYTRGGLSVKDRELVVFCAIAALGGCEPQLRSHIGANLRQGTTKAQLVEVLRVVLPYLGFPRTLNALNQVDLVTKEKK